VRTLPIRVGKGPKDEPDFRFRVLDGKKEERVYHLIQTVVRRVREANESTGNHKPANSKTAANERKWRVSKSDRNDIARTFTARGCGE